MLISAYPMALTGKVCMCYTGGRWCNATFHKQPPATLPFRQEVCPPDTTKPPYHAGPSSSPTISTLTSAQPASPCAASASAPGSMP